MKAEEIRRRYQKHRSDRTTIEQTWDMIERYIAPLQGGKFFQDQSMEGEMDWNRSRYIFDSTALMAHQTLSSSIHSNITSPSDRWFDVRFKQEELNNDSSARAWLEQCGEIVYQTLQESNFNLEINKTYMDLTAFGNSVIVEEVPDEITWQGIDFSAVPIREIFFDPGQRNSIRCLYRRLQWEPSKIIDKFGDVPDCIREAYEKGDPTRRDIIFCIYYREDKANVDVSKPLAPTERPYGYKYILLNPLEELGEEGGYYEMPAFLAKWSESSGSKWGHGPGSTAIGDVITLNSVVEMTLAAAAKAIDPPILTNQRNMLGDVDLKPGGETVVRDINGMRPFESAARFDVANLQIERLQDAIRQAFHNHQLELRESPAMTATEVQVRYELMQKVLGTVLGQLQSGLLDPIIQRTFNILMRAGRLPEMPSVIAQYQGTMEIEYTGPMSRSQRSDKAVAMDRFLMTINQYGQMLPSLLDLIKPDEFGRMMAEYMGVPATVLNSAEEFAAIQQQKQEQQAQAQEQQEIMMASEAVKNMGSAMGGMGGQQPVQ